MDKIKCAIVGCGRISDLHARAYAGSQDADIFAVCDMNADLAKKRKEEWGARKVFTDYEELLKDPDIQAVELLVPHHLHREMTVAAAQAKKHISVQKPMANKVSEAREMVAAAKEHKVLLKVFENFVFYPPYLKAKELVAEGAIGTLITVRMRLTTAGKGGWTIPGEAWMWRMDPEKGGGGLIVFDDGYHKFSQAYDIGGEVEKVHAWIDHTNVVVDAPAFITWKYKEGQRARYGAYDITFAPDMFMNSDYYTSDDKIELVGSEGIIYINRTTGKMIQEPSVVLYRDGETRCFHALRDEWGESFIDSGRHFFSCIKNGGDPILSGETGLAVLRFALAPEMSAREGRDVQPDTIDF
jgi:predicted dehydrogenase